MLASNLHQLISGAISLIILFFPILLRDSKYFNRYMGIVIPLVTIPWACTLSYHNITWHPLYDIAFCLIYCWLAIFYFFAPSDAPKPTSKEDTYGRRLFYRKTYETISEFLNSEPNHSLSIAIYGAWGSGKTHMISYIVDKLCNDPSNTKPHYIHCNIDLWRCNDYDSMCRDLSSAIASAISGRCENRGILGTIYSKVRQSVQNSYMPLVDIIMELFSSSIDNKQKSDKRSKLLGYPDKAAIIVFDNLERCKAELLRDFFPLIEKLKSVEGIITICGITYDRLTESLSNLQSASQHPSLLDSAQIDSILLKLIDLPISLPPLNTEYAYDNMVRYIKHLGLHCPNLIEWLKDSGIHFETPRQYEKVISALAYIDHCYLQRLHEKNQKKRLINIMMGENSIATVFTYETLRVLFPNIVCIIERCSQPADTIHKIEDGNFDNDGNYQIMERSKITLPDDLLCIKRIYYNSSLLRKILCRLKKYSKKDLVYAINLSYTHFGELTMDERTSIVSYYKEHQDITPLEAIKHEFKNAISPKQERELLIDLFNYITTSTHDRNDESLILAIIDNHIINNQYHNFIFHSKFILSLLNASLIEKETLENSPIETALSKTLDATSLYTLSCVLEYIWGHKNDLPYKGRLPDYEIENLDNALELGESVIALGMLCQHWAYKTCQNIATTNDSSDNIHNCIFAACKGWEALENEADITAGVKSFMSDHKGSLIDLPTVINSLKKIITYYNSCDETTTLLCYHPFAHLIFSLISEYAEDDHHALNQSNKAIENFYANLEKYPPSSENTEDPTIQSLSSGYKLLTDYFKQLKPDK